MIDDTTYTVFKSEKISFETKKEDYRYVKSTRNIKSGELLLVEHCYSTQDNNNQLIRLMGLSPDLFNSLYPRNCNFYDIKDDKEKLNEACANKIQSNVFKIDGFTIGRDISRFNNSNRPNACVSISVGNISIGNEKVRYDLMYVYSITDINIGDEINIFYSEGYHKLLSNKKIENIIINRKEEENIKELVDRIYTQYSKKEPCKNIILNHLCKHYGLGITKDEIIDTERFKRYFSKRPELHLILWIESQQQLINNIILTGEMCKYDIKSSNSKNIKYK
jgi:hypothetical protein